MAKKEKDSSASFEEIKEALKGELKEEIKGEEENPKDFGSTVGEEWDMVDEDELVTKSPEETEEVIKEGEPEKKGETEVKVGEEKLKEDLIEYLEETGGTKVTIKGKEHDLRDLSPQEIKDRFSKAGRFYERMEEVSNKEKEIDRRASLLEQTVNIQQRPEQKQRMTRKATMPDFLKEDFEDTDKEKLLKEGMKTLITELDTLKAGVSQGISMQHENRFFTEAEKFKKDYPCASMDEVMLLKRMRPDVPTEKIMEKSHQHYSSPEFIESALEANPELKRTLYEKAIETHKTKGEKSSKIGRRRASSSGSEKITTPKTEGKPKNWAEADERAKAYLRTVRKLNEES